MGYEALRATVVRLLGRFGGPITVTRRGTAVLDPVTQARSPAAVQTQTLRGVALPPGQAHRFGVDLTGKRAKECYFAGSGALFTPGPGDEVQIDGAAWRIFWATSYDPDQAGVIMTMAYAERGAS